MNHESEVDINSVERQPAIDQKPEAEVSLVERQLERAVRKQHYWEDEVRKWQRLAEKIRNGKNGNALHAS